MRRTFFRHVLTIAISLHAAIGMAQTNNWVKNASGFWDEPSNWLLGLPTSGQDVSIGFDPYAFTGITTTFRSGSMSIRSLATADDFVMSGGSLTLGSGFSNLGSTFEFQGGTFLISTPQFLAGALSWSGGTLGGSS